MPEEARLEKIVAGLTDSQRAAVLYGDGPLLVVAGAGSGKTRVITRRIAALIERGVPPDRIIAITFTNKAADEMRRRVEALVGAGVYVSTFHSFCARLLRREISRMGRDAGFTIYDRSDSLRVVRRIVKEMEIDPTTFAPRKLLEWISVSKDRCQDPEKCRADALGIEEETYAEVYRRYEEQLAANNALDFDDLLLKTLTLFREHPAALASLQERYLHVLVDEYQDTNLPQHLIARALQGKHRNITAVGDPDQMIYTWRGARLENLMQFEEDFPGTEIITLERNYRSSGNILRASGKCIEHNVLRRPKELWTERDEGEKIVLGTLDDSYDEADWVGERTEELLADGVAPSDIAVFYRTKQQSLPLEDAFAQRSIAHQVVDSVGFFDRAGVKDIRAYLQLLVNPRDDESCLRIINTPSRGIGARTVEKLQAAAQARGCSLVEAARDVEQLDQLSGRAKTAVGRFWQLYRELHELEPEGVADLIRKILDRTSYVERQPLDERADAQELMDMFIGYAGQYDRRSPDGGLMGFLEQAALVSDVDGWNAQASAVPFMTLHSAKGLEFDAVFLVGLEEDMLPHRRAIEEHAQGTEEGAIEEERRLFYVGMTRARHRLFISHANRRVLRGREEPTVPSRFLDELPEDCIERDESRKTVRTPAGSFAREMDSVVNRKLGAIEVLDGDTLKAGVRVRHGRFGTGMVLECSAIGDRHMIRVNFFDHGTMALILGAGDVEAE